MREEGRFLSEKEVRNFDYNGTELPVCLVDNGAFTAAGIAYDPRERDDFLRDDGRTKYWFAVRRSRLFPWLPKEWGGAA